MASSNRVEALKAMLSEDPGNAFARYGLAMEYMNAGQLEEAIGEFRALLQVNPGYPAAYYHGGRALEKLGELEQAREMYQKGIELTTRTGDSHTRAELQAALDLLP
jgi:tetratricopeptide (TPR) repeat protein